jgi:type I restriction-modification system DNA methylase subunit
MKTIKALEKIASNQHIHNVFDDFLQMTVSAFCMKKDEENYLNRAKKYNESQIQMFSEALACLFEDYENQSDGDGGWNDIIGNCFEELLLSNAKTGQFFTPKTLCDLMAQLTQSDLTEGTVNDPSSGSSRNLIAHSRLNKDNRFNFFYVAQDLDIRCCLMSVINYVMYGMKGIIIHSNTLTMEIYKGWRVYLPETGLFVVPLTKNECISYLIEQKKEPEKIIEISNEQLKLF